MEKQILDFWAMENIVVNEIPSERCKDSPWNDDDGDCDCDCSD